MLLPAAAADDDDDDDKIILVLYMSLDATPPSTPWKAYDERKYTIEEFCERKENYKVYMMWRPTCHQNNKLRYIVRAYNYLLYNATDDSKYDDE